MANTDKAARSRRSGTWQFRLRRGIGVTLLLKLLALLALWLLFFSPAHRFSVTPAAVDTRLSVDAIMEPAPPAAEGMPDD
jgi:hypothetical protein